jgi:hypothetical protein
MAEEGAAASVQLAAPRRVFEGYLRVFPLQYRALKYRTTR